MPARVPARPTRQNVRCGSRLLELPATPGRQRDRPAPRSGLQGRSSRWAKAICAFNGQAVSHTGRVATERKRGAHASGEFVVADDFLHAVRERRRRGTRLALDWKYSFRLYAFVPLALLFGFVGGIDLSGDDAWWQRLAGGLLLLASTVVLALLIRWLGRPVDPASKEKLHKHYDEMRLGNIWRDVRK